MRRLLGLVLLTLACAAPAAAQGVDQTCLLALTRFDAGTVNIAFPDDSAQYWVGGYAAIPGTRLRITGRFPHARYMSFNVYDPALRPLDAIADAQIVPDAGSTNPFLAGADRTAPKRSYTVFVEFGPKPAKPAPNTIYTGTGQNGTPNYAGTLIYRIYIPDSGTGEFGGTEIPTVTAEPASASGPIAPSLCGTFSKPAVSGINEALANANSIPGLDKVTPSAGRNPPRWRKFTNLVAALGYGVSDSDATDPIFQALHRLDLDTLGGSGGFLSNIHNSYVSAITNRQLGEVVVTRFKPPTFPDTRPGAERMPSGQVRYWSVCQNDSLTQRFVACLNDDRSVIGADGFATFVTSAPNQRPANATRACGVNWLPWGLSSRTVLILRHMLPDPGFGASVQRAPVDHEADTMGDGFPRSRYYAGPAAYEQTGCAGVVLPAARSCTSRRAFTIRLPRNAVSARVRVNGKLVRTLRGKRLPARVDLRGLPRTRVRVTISARLRSGRVVHLTRTYRTCVRE
jgi:hypothetical protein